MLLIGGTVDVAWIARTGELGSKRPLRVHVRIKISVMLLGIVSSPYHTLTDFSCARHSQAQAPHLVGNRLYGGV